MGGRWALGEYLSHSAQVVPCPRYLRPKSAFETVFGRASPLIRAALVMGWQARRGHTVGASVGARKAEWEPERVPSHGVSIPKVPRVETR